MGVHPPPNHLQSAFAAWRRTLPATERARDPLTVRRGNYWPSPLAQLSLPRT
ncbi:hypothetical protein ACPCKW_25260 [Streptomyces griseoincarnatus]